MAGFLAAAPVAAQDAGGLRNDLMTVLGSALFPVQLMAYCHQEIDADSLFRAVAMAWNERNGDLWQNIQERAKSAGISDAEQADLDKAALAGIEAMVGSQGDKPAYCRFIASIIEGGYYDLDQRDDLKPALKRIFPKQ